MMKNVELMLILQVCVCLLFMQSAQAQSSDACVQAAAKLQRSLQLEAGTEAEANILAEVIKDCPSMREAHFNLGNNLLRQGKYQEAEQSFNEALKLRVDAEALVGLGSALGRQAKNEEAKAKFEEASKLAADHIGALQGMAWVAEQQSDLNTALSLLQRALALAPGDATVWLNLGSVREAMGDMEGAREAYSAATERRTGYIEAFTRLGSLQVKRGELAEAQKTLERASLFGLETKDLTLLKALVLEKSEKYKPALAILEQAHAKWPNDAQLISQLGVVHIQLGRFDDGISKLEQAVVMLPNNAELRSALGWGLLKKRELERAQRELEQAILMDADNARALYNLGLVYELRGDNNEAQRFFERAKLAEQS